MTGKKNKRVKTTPPAKGKKGKKSVEAATLLDEVEAMSSSDEGSVENQNKSWNAKAAALKKVIQGGDFDKILDGADDDDDDDSIEDVVLGDDDQQESSEEKKPAKNKGKAAKKISKAAKNDDDEEAEEEDEEEDVESDSEKAEGEDEEEAEEEEDEEQKARDALYDANSKALRATTEELVAAKKGFPWAETFDIIPATPLPFGTVDEETGLKIDVHDDLKREVAFYDQAMEAVEEARMQCKDLNVSFTRPDDFFAEMVKSDDHMARIKDRLIFENKKIDAVTQRKSNREQKLRSKEAQSNKIAEKSKRKKDNMKQVDDWAQSAASERGGRSSDNADQKYLSKIQGGGAGQKRPWKDRDGNYQTGPNKKRMNADKKYGFGGKQGRFKQNSQTEINDMSSYNPKGNFSAGSKKGGGGAGAGRQGKRARDAGRSRQGS